MKTPQIGLLLQLTLLGFLCACPAALSQDKGEQLRLVPFPKELRLQPAQFRLDQPLTFEVPDGRASVLAQLLNDELTRAGLKPAAIRPLKSSAPAFRLSATKGALSLPVLPTATAPEAYAIEVRAGEIVCAAKEPAGLFYGLQTLCQLLRANRQGDALPCLMIRDWPTLRWRCFQDDMTRGPSSTLDTLKTEASLGAYLKFNLMTYYMEYQYAFKKHPQIGPTNGSLTPADLAALVKHGQSLHLDILGNQQSFGHFGAILKHPEFERLRETADVLTPVREETYKFLDDLYSESCPLLPFHWFNVCCDETWGLGTGPSRELAAQIGVGGVYVRHIRRVHDLLRDKYQKRMMMWGDIILQHPDQLKEVPKDTIMLTWGYDARPSFEDQILPFSKSGYEFFVCPGVNNWSRILPDFGVAMTNIGNFVRDGAKHGALGMINTDWEDDGEALNAVKWHADAWAAECAWNGSTTSPQLFNRRVGAVLFGEAGDDFGQAVELLSRAHRLPAMKGMFNARFWEKDFSQQTNPTAIESAATNLLAVVRPALRHLEACRQQARENPHVLDVFLFGARRMELIGQRMLDGLEAARLYEQACQSSTASSELQRIEKLIRKNRDAHETLGRQFAALWLSQSKPYALDWTLARYTNAVNEYESLLRKLALAHKAALAGQRLPAPEEAGLAIPRPLDFREGGIIRGPKWSRKLSLVFTGHGYAEGGETILNELAKHKAKASCFFTGAFLTNANFTALVQRLVKEGHYLGPHSDKHVLYCPWEGPKKTLVTQAEFTSDLESNLKKIEAFGVKRPQVRYFLPPYEHYNQEIVDWSKAMGLTLVNFTPGTRSTADYTGEAEKNFVSSKTIFDSIVTKERQDPNGLNGFILLLHIGSGPGRADKFHARFGELLDYLAGKGYQFVRVDELVDAHK